MKLSKVFFISVYIYDNARVVFLLFLCIYMFIGMRRVFSLDVVLFSKYKYN